MSRKKVLLVLLAVLVATAWVGYRITIEREMQGAEREERAEELESEPEKPLEEDRLEELTLQYFGHSAFKIEAGGISILTDPYSPQVGYEHLELEVDLVTISHEHMDHNYSAASPNARVLRGLGAGGLNWEDISFTEGEISIFNHPSYHDDAVGRLRGKNSIFVFDLGQMRLVHLGDLGHFLNEGAVEKISPVDILLIPVGGHYTLDAEEAWQVIEDLEPGIAVPMHYRTEATRNWPITGLEPFTEGKETVYYKNEDTILIRAGDMPMQTEIWILEPVMLP